MVSIAIEIGVEGARTLSTLSNLTALNLTQNKIGAEGSRYDPFVLTNCYRLSRPLGNPMLRNRMTQLINGHVAPAVILLAVAFALTAASAVADEQIKSFSGAKSTYHGFDRFDFEVDGQKCLVVTPKSAAKGNPWIWRAEFFDHRPEIDLALVNKGFHLVYMNVGNTFGCPSAMKHFDAFYDVLTRQHGLSKKPVLEGLSRGGLYVYNWGAAHPDQVGVILADNPVCDFKSWPGGKGKGPGSAGDWKKLIGDYGFADEAAALTYDKNPIDNLAPLAKAKIPLLHICGDADEVVPYAENTVILKERFEKLGGKIHVIVKPGLKHHPHGLDDPKPAVDFIVKQLGLD